MSIPTVPSDLSEGCSMPEAVFARKGWLELIEVLCQLMKIVECLAKHFRETQSLGCIYCVGAFPLITLRLRCVSDLREEISGGVVAGISCWLGWSQNRRTRERCDVPDDCIRVDFRIIADLCRAPWHAYFFMLTTFKAVIKICDRGIQIRKQGHDLVTVIGIVGFRHDHRNHSASAAFCAFTSCAIPASARSVSSPIWVRVKGSPSAVPCSSTMPPEPVMTTFMSVSQSESSG